MTEEEARRQREALLNRLDTMTASFAASSQRMADSAVSLLNLSESLDTMTGALESLDERFERLEQFLAWLSNRPSTDARKDPIQEFLKIFGK